MSGGEKRLRRLQLRTRQKFMDLEHDLRIEFVETPTRFLYVGNGGLDCGVDHVTLLNMFSEHGVVANIVMQPHRPYAFVQMNNTVFEDAFKQINGRCLTSLTTSPRPAIHLSYINHLPEKLASRKEISSGMQLACTLPSGLRLIPNFVSEDEEARLLAAVTSAEEPNHAAGHVCGRLLRHRQVKHYGYEFIYGSNDIDLSKPLKRKMPAECDLLIERMTVKGCVQHRPDQLTVNEYEPGQGIPPHVDTHSAFEDGIASLSLGAQTVMEFSHPVHPKCKVLLSQRSLLVMTGESRYVWTHGIASRKSDIIDSSVFKVDGGKQVEPVIQPRGKRVSLTFRTVRGKPCICGYFKYCDRVSYSSQKKATEIVNRDSVTVQSCLSNSLIIQQEESTLTL